MLGLKAAVAATAAVLALGSVQPAQAASPLDDAFYHDTGSTPLAQLAPGTVLGTRTVPYSIQGLDLPLKATEILYRTQDALGRPVANATTVVRPLLPLGPTKVASYQSIYDSTDPADEPSAAIAGGRGLGDGIANFETLLIAPLLLAGYTVNVPDTEGQTADFATGPEYGVTTLDSLRAITAVAGTGVTTADPVGLIGYSGGAIASEWAAELAPSYAPDVASRLVGTALGGVLVDPAHNLHYIDGSLVWAGVMPQALVGISRAYGVDLTQYASDYGKQVMAKLQRASIAKVLGEYPGLTWAKIAKPQYPSPESIPAYVDIANRLIMGTGGTPNAPMFIGQGTGGELEGTAASPDYGKGDAVMLAGDVRTLARTYCARGVTVDYQQYATSHITSIVQWVAQAMPWLMDRFGGSSAPSSCGSIAPGNALDPIPVPRAASTSPASVAGSIRWSHKVRSRRAFRVTPTSASGPVTYTWRVGRRVVSTSGTRLVRRAAYHGKRVRLTVTATVGSARRSRTLTWRAR